MSGTPEHEKRFTGEGPIHPDISAAYDYMDRISGTADAGGAGMGMKAWHGWALREAFLAGMSAVDERARQLLKSIDDDERYHYPPADIHINAPLALVQMGMKGAVQALTQVLERNSK